MDPVPCYLSPPDCISKNVNRTHSEIYMLALLARDGDREVLARLVEQTRMRLFALAYAETGDLSICLL